MPFSPARPRTWDAVASSATPTAAGSLSSRGHNQHDIKYSESGTPSERSGRPLHTTGITSPPSTPPKLSKSSNQDRAPLSQPPEVHTRLVPGIQESHSFHHALLVESAHFLPSPPITPPREGRPLLPVVSKLRDTPLGVSGNAASDTQCTAITLKGTRCSRNGKAQGSDYDNQASGRAREYHCWQHSNCIKPIQPPSNVQPLDPPASRVSNLSNSLARCQPQSISPPTPQAGPLDTQCSATTLKGTRCSRRGTQEQEHVTHGSVSTEPRVFYCWQHAKTEPRPAVPRSISRVTQLPKPVTPSKPPESETRHENPIWENDANAPLNSRCSAITARGTRCPRRGTFKQTASPGHPTSSGPQERRCWQHARLATKPASSSEDASLPPAQLPSSGAHGLDSPGAHTTSEHRGTSCVDTQCTAITKKGTRCSRRIAQKRQGAEAYAASAGRCWQHGGRGTSPDDELLDKTEPHDSSSQTSAVATSPTSPSRSTTSVTARQTRSQGLLRPELQSVIPNESDKNAVGNSTSPYNLRSAAVSSATPKFEHRDWVPNYLQPETQRKLRKLMDELIADYDEDGYIYALELRELDVGQNQPQDFIIKVGRSFHVDQRVATWKKHFTSKELVVRGWWPGTIEQGGSSELIDSSPSQIKNMVEAGPRGRFCHRVEKLVLLELADVARHSAHLTPEFLAKFSSRESRNKIPSEPGYHPSRNPTMDRCIDCNRGHKEIFRLKRFISEEMAGREWECVVMPIIEKWGRFVTECF